MHVRVWFSVGSSVGSQPFQLLQPDKRITAVGYAMMAANVADGAVTADKIANGAITFRRADDEESVLT